MFGELKEGEDETAVGGREGESGGPGGVGDLSDGGLEDGCVEGVRGGDSSHPG